MNSINQIMQNTQKEKNEPADNKSDVSKSIN